MSAKRAVTVVLVAFILVSIIWLVVRQVSPGP